MAMSEQRDLPEAAEAARVEPAVRPARADWSWLLRTTAATAFLAAVAGVLVAPGLRGLARDRVVDVSNHVAWTLAYFLSGLLVALTGIAAYELSRTGRLESIWKGIGVSSAGLAMALAMPALARPLPSLEAAALAAVTSIVVLSAALYALRAKHTRGVAVVMGSFAIAAFLRIVAWELARVAGEGGNSSLYVKARLLATVAVGFEAMGQMVTAAWLGTRSRFAGQALSSIAVALAWILTLSASSGAGLSANHWQAAAHIALATASALPQPYAPNALQVFLLAASILLAGVAAAQPRQVVAVVVALSLALVGRGVFDVPIHALAATAGAMWLMVAVSDERAMWRALLASRAVRDLRRTPDAVQVRARTPVETPRPPPGPVS